MGRLSLLALCLGCCLYSTQPLALPEDMPDDVRQALLLGNPKAAVTWLQDAAAQGDSAAAFELAKLYRLGNGVTKNRARSEALLQQAAADGYADAAKLLAQLSQSANEQQSTPRGGQGSTQTNGSAWFASISAAKPPPTAQPISNPNTKNDGGTPLVLYAVDQGATAWVKYLIKQKADLTATDARGNSVLHSAVRSKDASILKLLLAAGAPIHQKNAEGSTALHLAAALGVKPAIRRLLRAGANSQMLNISGWSPVMIAERAEDAQLLALFGQKVSTQRKSSAASKTATAESLLHFVRLGNATEAKMILQRGISADTKNAGGEPALSVAVTRRHMGAVRALLAAGADPNQTTNRQATPLHAATQIRSPATTRLLLQADANPNVRDAASRTPLHNAVASGCLECLTLLVEEGAQLDAADKLGSTALLLAAKAGRKPMVDALLQAGANRHVTDHASRSPLWWAVKNERKPAALSLMHQQLVDKKLNQADLAGLTPLHLAVQHSDLELVGRLASPATINAPTQRGSTPLSLAAHAGETQVAELLLSLGADVDQQNNNGDTPLMEAITQQEQSTAMLLVKAGASLDIHNVHGQSAKTLIQSIDQPEWTAMLEEADGMLAAIIKRIGR